jgi:hypothetical protein
VGYGPLFVAEERGFFAKEGVAVELINIDDHTAAFAGLFAGQVDAVAAGTQHVLTFSEPDEERLVRVLPLEGKSVAVLRGSLQHFYLNILLKQARLTEADIEIVDLPADDSAEVFMMARRTPRRAAQQEGADWSRRSDSCRRGGRSNGGSYSPLDDEAVAERRCAPGHFSFPHHFRLQYAGSR